LDQQTEPAGASDRLIAYQPALDGLRALAVAMVLCFHHGWTWMRGGYVGVSVFFTLSGFLITTLLLNEHARDRRISPARFYQRRIKRLLPASLVCLLGVTVLSWVHWLPASDRLRGDVAAAALQVFNWRALTGSVSYAQLLGASRADSAVAHFWSLSIEEQFYWVWPFLVVGLLALAKSARARRWTLTAVTLAAMVLPRVIAVRWGADATYWSTPARLAEILLGALVAVWLPVWAGRIPRLVSHALAAGGLVVALWAAASWPRSSGPAYQGLLPLFAVASAAVILGLQQAGPFTTVLSLRPIVWLGRVSFGVYLYHWPLYLVLDEQRTGLYGEQLFAVRVAVTLAVAAASYRLLERPVRTSSLHGPRVAAFATVGVVAVVALTFTIPQPRPAFDYDPLVSDGFGPGDSQDGLPVRILVVGDSTALTLAYGMHGWAAANPQLVQAEAVTRPGCGVMAGSSMVGDTDGEFRRKCDEAMGEKLDEILANGVPDLVVVMVSLPDGVDRRWDDGTVLAPTDAEYVRRRGADYAAFVARLRDAGVPHVAWLLGAPPAAWYAEEHHDQDWGLIDTEGINDTVRSLTEPDLCIIDFAGYIAGLEADGDHSLREDGLHLTADTARQVLDDHLGQQLIDAALGSCPSTTGGA